MCDIPCAMAGRQLAAMFLLLTAKLTNAGYPAKILLYPS
jgi:hypothetical protein